MKQLSVICFSSLLAITATNQALAMQAITTLGGITASNLISPPTLTIAQELPILTKHLKKKYSPDKITAKLYALTPYLQHPAGGSQIVLVKLLEIMDRIYSAVTQQQSLSITEILGQVATDPDMQVIDHDIIAYMYHLMTAEDKLEASDEDILEALCDTSTLRKFKINKMQIAYLESHGCPNAMINNHLEHLEEDAATCSLTAEDPGKFIALLCLIDWMRNQPIKNNNQPSNNIIIKLRDELPDVYHILHKDMIEFNQIITNLIPILPEASMLPNEEIVEILAANLQQKERQLEQQQIDFVAQQTYQNEEFTAKLQTMQEYMHNFKSVFQQPEIFSPLLDTIDQALDYLHADRKMSSEALTAKIKQHLSATDINEDTIKQIHYLITAKKLSDKDDIIAELNAMNQDACKYDALYPRGFDLSEPEHYAGHNTIPNSDISDHDLFWS